MMGRYVIYADFNGDDKYTSRRSKLCFLDGVNPHLKVSVNDIDTLTYNEENTITGKVRKLDNSAIGGFHIHVYIVTPDNTIVTRYPMVNSYGNWSTTYTPTTRGAYTIYAFTDETEEYSKSTSTELVVYTDSLDTVTALTCDVESTVVGSTIQLTATVSSGDNRLSGLTVYFYKGDVLINPNNQNAPTTKTNSKGECTISTNISTVGTHTYHCVVMGNELYNTSTSANLSITATAHTLDISLYNSSVYRGRYPKVQIRNEKNEPVNQLPCSVTVNNQSMNLTTDINGMVTLPVTLNEGTYTVNVNVNGVTGYTNTTKALTLKVLDDVTVTNSNLSASNVDTSIPYKSWENLSNLRVGNDGNYTVCGTNCSSNTLAGTNGSRNTPATLRFSNLGFNIPTGSTLQSLTVNMKIRTLSCSSDTAKVVISNPTLRLGSNSVVMTLPSTGNLPYKNFGTVTGQLNLSGITVAQLNNSSTYFTIQFPKNTSTNIGKVQIDYVEVKVRYTPPEV